MGLFINGMAMPKNCLNCNLKADCCYSIEESGVDYKTFKPEECPLSEAIRCNECKYYQGVHGVQGHAPCTFWKCGAVMWDDFCSKGVKCK